MIASNSGKGRQHINKLIKSDPDVILLAEAVEHRFVLLLSDYFRITGEPLLPPPMYNADMMLWRTLRVRHREGDNRHTIDELKATRRIAQWTVDEKKKLAGQPTKKVDWKA